MKHPIPVLQSESGIQGSLLSLLHYRSIRFVSILLLSLLFSSTLTVFSSAQLHRVHAQSSATISVDANTTYQAIDGFGAAEPPQMATSVYTMNSAQQQQVLDLLFNSSTGAGLSILRFELGSGQNYNSPGFTIEPNNPGSPTATPSYVWDHSADNQVWMTQQAQQRGVSTIYADAWSAPAYMKSNNDVNNGGTLCGEVSCSSGDWRQAYANYLVQYLKDFQSEGVNVNYVDFVNEPSLSTAYQSMVMNASQLTDFTKILGPTIANAGLSTKIACCDESGFDNSNTVQNTLLADSTAASYEAVATAHGYSGQEAAFTSATNAGKHIWQTEHTCFDSGWNGAYSTGACDGQAWSDNIYNALQNGISAYNYWVGAEYSTTPSIANFSLVGITSSSSYDVSARLWAFANYSRYIRPGAVRIGASSNDGNMYVTGAKNSDGSYVLVVDNHEGSTTSTTINIPAISSGTATPYVTNDSGGMQQQTDISVNNGSFSVNMPPNSTITFKLTGGTSNTLANGRYALQNNTNTGEYLALDGNTTADGTHADIWPWVNASTQYWTITSVGNGEYTIQNGTSGEYLALDNNVASDGQQVDVWHWVNAATQYWTITSVGNGEYTIQNGTSGEYLAMDGNATADGTQADVWPWVNASTQYWTLSSR